MRHDRCLVVGAFLLYGCGEPSDAENGAAETEDRPSPYAETGADPDAEVPVLAVEQVIDLGFEGLRSFLALDPQGVIDAYISIAVTDDDCPEEQIAYDEDGAETVEWYSEGCTTAEGVQFSGSGRLSIETNEDGDAVFSNLSTDGGAIRVVSGNTFFEMGGEVLIYRDENEDYTEAGIDIVGTFSADANTAAGSSLLDGSLSVRGSLYTYSDESGNGLGGSGTLTGLGIGGARAIAFADFVVDSDECVAEPLGTVSVRDELGFWHDIVFDAGVVTGDEGVAYGDPELCDGCGAYIAGGERLGEACVPETQVQSLLDWNGAPW